MKHLLWGMLLLLSTLTVTAQKFEGKIVFKMTYDKLDAQTQSMMPTESSAYYKDGYSRIEMSMGMGMKNVTITNPKENKTVVLMDMMGQKYAITPSADDAESKKQLEQTTVTIGKETQMIAGYKCTKAIVEAPSKEKGTQKMEVWFTKELSIPNGQANGPMSKIEGAILKYTIEQGPVQITMTADKVTKEPVADEKFVVPADYKVVTQEELMKAMGGGAGGQ